MAKKPNKSKNASPHIYNRKARHDYHITDKLEVGIVLQGSEVKSIRNGQVSLAEGFARIDPNLEMYLCGVNVAGYSQAHGANGHEPTRIRKLLAHRREIKKLLGLTTSKGVTLVPLEMYFNDQGKVKVQLGVASGKKTIDKRQDIKKRDTDRDLRRAMTRKVI